MTKSGPDDEVSFGVELTQTGITGKAKGRALAMFQRWLGSALAPAIARNNRVAARERFLGALEQKAMQQMGPEALKRLSEDEGVVDDLIGALSLPGTDRKIENKGAVFGKAVEDLRLNPPTEQQSASGASEITPEVADRLEQYASGATREEVRERWGRVVAAEIRQPGTFSLKVLRIIDELDEALPILFEKVAEHRIGNHVPRCLSGELRYGDEIDLVDAGLLHDPGSGGAFQLRLWESSTYLNQEVWRHRNDDMFLTIKRDGPFSIPADGSSLISAENLSSAPLLAEKEKPAIPIYLFTSAGYAITSILPPVDNSIRYLKLLRGVVPQTRLYRLRDSQWVEQEPVPKEMDIVENAEPSVS